MNDKVKLKPCPFCGSRIKQYCFEPDEMVFFRCVQCNAVISFDETRDNDLMAITEAWNRRANNCKNSVNFGEWIPDDYEYNHCSECGYEMNEREYTTPYCPNCGAKMEESEENDVQ